MSPQRRYQLQSEEANGRIQALLGQLSVPRRSARLYEEMLTTVLKQLEDGTQGVDLKLTNSALKELRYGFKVFEPYRHIRKVTVFGSARTPVDHLVSQQALRFGKRMTDAGWMVITGAGSGVMGAAQAGAGRDQSFGLNIRLPTEQEANPWIADDPKLITFKYFFTRKLFLVREAHAMVLFPGGFGTLDEAFETLTLVQTGKAPLVPVVLVDAPGGRYWQSLEALVRDQMLATGMISPDDIALFRVADDVDLAIAEIERFYAVYHSQRYVGETLVVRLRRPVASSVVRALSVQFADILTAPVEQTAGPLAAENGELPELPRLVVPFTRNDFGRLRRLIDVVNQS